MTRSNYIMMSSLLVLVLYSCCIVVVYADTDNELETTTFTSAGDSNAPDVILPEEILQEVREQIKVVSDTVDKKLKEAEKGYEDKEKEADANLQKLINMRDQQIKDGEDRIAAVKKKQVLAQKRLSEIQENGIYPDNQMEKTDLHPPLIEGSYTPSTTSLRSVLYFMGIAVATFVAASFGVEYLRKNSNNNNIHRVPSSSSSSPPPSLSTTKLPATIAPITTSTSSTTTTTSSTFATIATAPTTTTTRATAKTTPVVVVGVQTNSNKNATASSSNSLEDADDDEDEEDEDLFSDEDD